MVFCFHLYAYYSSWFMGFYVDGIFGRFWHACFWLVDLFSVVSGLVCDVVDFGWLILSLMVDVFEVLVLGCGGVVWVVLDGFWEGFERGLVVCGDVFCGQLACTVSV